MGALDEEDAIIGGGRRSSEDVQADVFGWVVEALLQIVHRSLSIGVNRRARQITLRLRQLGLSFRAFLLAVCRDIARRMYSSNFGTVKPMRPRSGE